MRIAHVCPVSDEVSFNSRTQEGRGVAVLTEGLVRLGCDISVFASGDSSISGTLVPVVQRALRHHPAPKRHLSEGLVYLGLEKAFAVSPGFDLIHVHADFVAFPLMRRSPIPILATVYGPLDTPEVAQVYREFKELSLVATSVDQMRRCPNLNWQALIPWNGSSHDPRRFAERPGAFEEIASAYASVYERMVPTHYRRRRASRGAHSREDMATPV